jgi:PTS system nitrogen regulatory IIA component
MQLEDILTPERCFCGVSGVSKKRLLKEISEKIANNLEYLSANQIFDALMSREQLGSTGLGNGIAIPHCRVAACNEVVGCLVTLENPVDFDAVDANPVDLLFVLIVPEEKTDEHVKLLAKLAGLFSDEGFCHMLRNTQDKAVLFKALVTH